MPLVFKECQQQEIMFIAPVFITCLMVYLAVEMFIAEIVKLMVSQLEEFLHRMGVNLLSSATPQTA